MSRFHTLVAVALAPFLVLGCADAPTTPLSSPLSTGAPAAVSSGSTIAGDGNETIVITQAAVRGPGDVWSASGLFTDSGRWRRAVSFQGTGPYTFEAERFTTEYGALGSFRIDLQIHRNLVTDTGLYGTWVIDAGTDPDAPSGAYVGLRGQGTFTSTRDPLTGARTYTLVGDVHFQ